MVLMAMTVGMMVDQAIGAEAVATIFNARGSPFAAGAYSVTIIGNGGGPNEFPGGGLNAEAGGLGERITATVFLPPDTVASISENPDYHVNGNNVSLRNAAGVGVTATGGLKGGNPGSTPVPGYSYSPAGSLFWGQPSQALITRIGEGGSGLVGQPSQSEYMGKLGLIRFRKVG